jgi:sortase A
MRNKIGTFLMLCGMVLLLSSLGLFLSNRREAENAELQSAILLPQLVDLAQQQETREETRLPEPEIPQELLTAEDVKMEEVELDGHRYIGYLSMPTLDKELPIMSTWSYPQLKIAPCRYSGSLRGEDLVLMAHNYVSHFGPIHRLEIGDPVIFTDMYGNITEYVVVGTDILDPSAVDAMTAGDFDLTLFTCNYGGSNRITVYCDLVRT